MAETHILAQKDYIKGMKYKDIAEKHGVSINTVKSWKRRHGWERNKGAPKEKSVHTKKPGAPKGSKNALGNKGGAAPKGNSNAVTHGLFAKYLPEETLSIVNEIGDNISPLDILWSNIQIQFASILRAQKIMHVESKEEMIKELKKEKTTMDSEETEYEFQFAWDRQATFMNSLSRSMAELRSMLKQFYEMANYDDDRLMEVERMQLAIQKTKAEIDRLQDNDDHSDEVDEWVQAMGEIDE